MTVMENLESNGFVPLVMGHAQFWLHCKDRFILALTPDGSLFRLKRATPVEIFALIVTEYADATGQRDDQVLCGFAKRRMQELGVIQLADKCQPYEA